MAQSNYDSVLAIYGGVVAVCTTIEDDKESKDDALLAKVLLKIADSVFEVGY